MLAATEDLSQTTEKSLYKVSPTEPKIYKTILCLLSLGRKMFHKKSRYRNLTNLIYTMLTKLKPKIQFKI